mmetsp:Transcript_21365/g.39103  ORF Transcript_21365/g.39103 Transcript_21365/m.39103 type:complete len:124 (+) Transcript_21365:112-483(+)
MNAFLPTHCMAGSSTDGANREQLVRQCCHIEGETAIEIRIGKGPRTVPEGQLVERQQQFAYSGGLHPLSLTPMALTSKPSPGALSRGVDLPPSLMEDAARILDKPRYVIQPLAKQKSPEIAGQ